MSDRNIILFGILKTKKEVYKLNKERISIGRNRLSQIVINNNTISKDHAIIEFDEDNNAIIKDLNSSNGTYVNGQRLKVMPMRLKTGDKITFGKYDMEFTFEALNTNGDSKTEGDFNNYMINGNTFNNMNNLSSVENNRVIFDKKINLVNENEISFARMNHFQTNNKTLTKNSNNLKIEDNNNNYMENEINNYNENNDNNNEKILQNKIDELEKKILEIENEKEELNKKNMELTDDFNKKLGELKKMTNLFDELNEEYSKLNAKHNALMVYASDIQKKLDLSNIELSQIKNKCHGNEDTDKIINEKENIIAILQNEVNYYKKLCGKNNNFNYNAFPQNDFNINHKLDSLIDKYISENKKLKQQNDTYKKKLKNYQKKELINKNIDFGQFEIQINYQIDNFNSIIKDYNDRLNESLNKISELFEDSKKEEAAKYLVEQINNYMQENQRLISENAKLNTQIAEYQAQLNSLSNINVNKIINNNNIDENSEENNNDEIEELRNKVDELENLISKLNVIGGVDKMNEDNFNSNNNNLNIRDAFVNAMTELKKKDQIINELQNKIKDSINNNDNNFDFTNSKMNIK